MKTPGIYYGVIAAFCVLTLCIGIVTAADLTQSATNCTGRPGFGHGHPPSPNEMIPRLEQQGVDVTEVKTALQKGDAASVQAWHNNHRVAHKDEMAKSAGRFGPDKVIGRLEKLGIDVTTVRNALQNSDLSAVKEWLDAYREAHKDQMKNTRMTGKLHAQADP